MQSIAQNDAAGILAKAPVTLESIQSSYQTMFPFELISAAAAQFASTDVLLPNEVLSKALTLTEDSLDTIVAHLMSFERFIWLTIPKMEDGNNFGVTVQLAALKQMSDDRERLVKFLDELSKYASSRADALEKCKFPSSTGSKITSKSSSNGESKGGEKEGTSSSTESKVVESKTETAVDAPEVYFRKQAVVAVDTLFYSKAKMALRSAMTSYMMAIDFIEKNKEKIEKPKGSAGGRSAYSSMY